MASGSDGGHLHPHPTRRHRYRYFFYDKHHSWAGPEEARWSLDITEVEEFGIFSQADDLELTDAQGRHLYGVRSGPEGTLLPLGTRSQQVAKFHDSGPHWHGFPLAPLERNPDPPHPPVRAVPPEVLDRMVIAMLLTKTQRKRLLKGKHA